MSIRKSEFIEHEISLEEVKEGLRHLFLWGKKTFKDHTGEWVEVCISGQLNLFSDEIEAIPHVTEGL